ncbi:(2Fe-2S)-binding protein [Trujillonella endophytica]|uniref:Carbon-monoxide dehydrogenase small subunit n=1 Tax=Trujillonella endophytica TaxID=673521 RepID=A0A1H8VVI3_9ACTN|nr:(2Fe-2S)-binding protein [Trujillella endophytica]SEP19419.1 carbon-monoxide dehydrogenase small subunit [Trujillella endophytica]
MTGRTVRVTVNGVAYERSVEARRTLTDFIRDDLRLTGTHVGCEHGVCGACTVLLDGDAVRACLLLAVQVDGREIRTIEGLERDGQLHPLQEALRDCHSFQCGFCTPGFVMTAVALLEEGATPTEEELREELSGNLCRCTGYQSIVAGVSEAVRRVNGDGGGASGDARRVEEISR